MFATSLAMDAATLLSAMSPSKTCRVRVSSTRYRNDPYRARVMPFGKPMSPAFRAKKFYSPPAAIVPITAPAMPAASADVTPLAVPPPSPMVMEMPTQVKAEAPKAAAPAKVAAAPKAATPTPIVKKDAQAKPQEHFALIGFKHETAMYQAPFRVAVGDVVVVEADRGEHIGVVQSITTTKPSYNVPSRIMRRANAAEVALIDELSAKEKRVAASVQKLAESFGLGIRIVDVEFQTDHNKLTVFFASKVFVDFRKLQRSLFREFRCRIWLVNWAEVRPYTPVPVNPPVA